jgi:hypothetical protein
MVRGEFKAKDYGASFDSDRVSGIVIDDAQLQKLADRP